MDYLLALLTNLSAEPKFAGMAFSGVIGAFAFVAVVALYLVVRGAIDPAKRRVDALVEQSKSDSKGVWLGRLNRAVERWADHVLPRDGDERSKVRRSLIHAGFRSPTALQSFYGIKTLLAMTLPMAVFLLMSWLPGKSTFHVITSAAIAAGIGLFAPNYVLSKLVADRQRRLSIGLPDALDLLVVCTEAGLGLKAAIQRVADELAVSHPELSEELTLVNAENRAGVDRTEALYNLARRTGLDELRGLATLLAQTVRFGTSIADALRVYAEEFRDRRTQKAEEQAAKIGTKMIFPLVLCLFPSFFLVTIGPAIIGVLSMFHKI